MFSKCKTVKLYYKNTLNKLKRKPDHSRVSDSYLMKLLKLWFPVQTAPGSTPGGSSPYSVFYHDLNWGVTWINIIASSGLRSIKPEVTMKSRCTGPKIFFERESSLGAQALHEYTNQVTPPLPSFFFKFRLDPIFLCGRIALEVFVPWTSIAKSHQAARIQKNLYPSFRKMKCL